MSKPEPTAAQRGDQSAQDRALRVIGWIATFTGLAMFVSYIDQINLNLAGEKGSSVQPAMAVVNCSLWVTYGWLKERTDWPIILANAPGILFGGAALYTSF